MTLDLYLFSHAINGNGPLNTGNIELMLSNILEHEENVKHINNTYYKLYYSFK